MYIQILVGLSVLVAGQIPSTTTYIAPNVETVEVNVVPGAVSDDLDAIFERYFGENKHIMEAIAYCESTKRQFTNDGVVVRNPKTPDVGIFQVNVEYHGDTAKKMGINLYEIEGNMQYAKYMFDRNGTRDWNASKPCWSAMI